MPDQENGPVSPWEYADEGYLGPLTCERCGERIEVGQEVQERPALSLKFSHAGSSSCEEEVTD